MLHSKKKLYKIISVFFLCFILLLVPSASAHAQSIPSKIIQFFQVKLLGEDPSDNPESTETASPEPTILPTVSNITGIADTHNISLTWASIPDITDYEITLLHDNISETITSSATSITLSDLSSATKYTITIRSHKIIDNLESYSEPSEPYTIYTKPEKVSGLSLTKRSSDGTNASLYLSWNAMSADASYMVYYKTQESDDSAYINAGTTTTNSYTLKNLQHNTKYTVKVIAFAGSEDNLGEFSDCLTEYTSPVKPTAVKATTVSHTSIEISWTNNPTTDSYTIYRSKQDSTDFQKLITTSSAIYLDNDLTAGQVYTYYITAHKNETNLDSTSSKKLRVVTIPYEIQTAKVEKTSSSSIKISWKKTPSATGYLIYRRRPSGSFTKIASTTASSYTDKTVQDGTCYHYKVRSYADTTAVVSKMGNQIKVSTNPNNPSLTVKAGYGKVRLKWASVRGASGYYVYQKENNSYKLINTMEGKAGVSLEINDLTKNTSYTFKVVTYRNIYDETLLSTASSKSIMVLPSKSTSIKAIFTNTKKATIQSAPWKYMSLIDKAGNYSKSFIIPGLASTNVAGFPSTNMCPQGLEISSKYIFISAYDHAKEERSVIYVLSRSTRKLLTVIVLPDNPHAGGVCFDGSNIWISHGSYIKSIPLSDVAAAISQKKSYVEIQYAASFKVPLSAASFLTYYKKQLWVGYYNVSGNGTLYSYSIQNKNTEPQLEENSHCSIPSCVQGITFLSSKKIVFSRSSAILHQLDVYNFNSNASSISTGTRIKPFIVPHLNEEIDIYGSYLYINFESVITPLDPYRSDRVIAINTKTLNKLLK